MLVLKCGSNTLRCSNAVLRIVITVFTHHISINAADTTPPVPSKSGDADIASNANTNNNAG